MKVWWRTFQRTERRVLLGVFIMIAVWSFFMLGLAHGEDYWSNCIEAYQFCTKRPYHRDCSIWTTHGKPLSVNRAYYPAAQFNPNAHTPFCEENPWHMKCGYLSEMPPLIQEHTECPIPDCAQRCRTAPAPCVCK